MLLIWWIIGSMGWCDGGGDLFVRWMLFWFSCVSMLCEVVLLWLVSVLIELVVVVISWLYELLSLCRLVWVDSMLFSVSVSNSVVISSVRINEKVVGVCFMLVGFFVV